MGQKVAPYFAYLLLRKREMRSKGWTYSEDEFEDLVSREWRAMSPERKKQYKCAQDDTPTDTTEFPLASSHQETPMELRRFIGEVVGVSKADVTAHEFVTCWISSIDRVTPTNQNISVKELCLVRWSINSGIREVYHVILHNPFTLSDKSHYTSTACADFNVIAAEIIDFLGEAATVLVRRFNVTYIRTWLEGLVKQNGLGRTKLTILDQVAVAEQLIKSERGAVCEKMNLHKDLEEMSRSYMRMQIELEQNTRADCLHHSKHKLCALDCAVSDVYTIVSKLALFFGVRTLEGRHHISVGHKLPRRSHLCLTHKPEQVEALKHQSTVNLNGMKLNRRPYSRIGYQQRIRVRNDAAITSTNAQMESNIRENCVKISTAFLKFIRQYPGRTAPARPKLLNGKGQPSVPVKATMPIEKLIKQNLLIGVPTKLNDIELDQHENQNSNSNESHPSAKLIQVSEPMIATRAPRGRCTWSLIFSSAS